MYYYVFKSGLLMLNVCTLPSWFLQDTQVYQFCREGTAVPIKYTVKRCTTEYFLPLWTSDQSHRTFILLPKTAQISTQNSVVSSANKHTTCDPAVTRDTMCLKYGFSHGSWDDWKSVVSKSLRTESSWASKKRRQFTLKHTTLSITYSIIYRLMSYRLCLLPIWYAFSNTVGSIRQYNFPHCFSYTLIYSIRRKN